jgi:hypothetical protein
MYWTCYGINTGATSEWLRQFVKSLHAVIGNENKPILSS